MTDQQQPGRIYEVAKTIIQSPMGGWIIAIIVVCYMGWFTMRDRQVIYSDLSRLRETAITNLMDLQRLTRENQEISKENQKLLEEILRSVKSQRSEMITP